MNFFEHQSQAKRRTTLLVTYFLLAMLATAFLVNLVVYLTFVWASERVIPLGDWLLSPANLWATGVTLTVIAGGTLRKLWQLRGGGVSLAEMLHAREITPETQMSDERQLMNIIEEMSIASGIPVPRVYILDQEKSINAFVAGFRPTETVLVVTQGCIDQLDREELQGVIAHEYSHIFNADMRLNLRLLAVLNGILAIGKVGEFILYSNLRKRRTYHRRQSRDEMVPIAFLIVFSLALILIGYIGLFFGRLIKAAISRQRELLADASAVQFTRYPAGIAGALIKIRNGTGSHLDTSHAEDMSHMCFGETMTFSMAGLLATHPPIDERLTAIGPQWLARARVRARQNGTQAPAAPTEVSAAAHAAGGAAAFTAAATGAVASAPAGGAAATAAARPSASVGTVQPHHMGYARTILDTIPGPVRHQLHQPRAACWAVFALAISVSRSDIDELLPILSLSDIEAREVRSLVDSIEKLGSRLRLPMVDMAIPALKQLPEPERDDLLETLDKLIRADKRITLFEFVLTHILRDHLTNKSARNRKVRYHSYRPLQQDIRLLLSLLIYAGGHRDERATEVFHRVSGALLSPQSELLPIEACRLDQLPAALARLQGLTPMLKAPLLDACADAILIDGKVQVAEAELLRGVCTLLDCPMPPLFT